VALLFSVSATAASALDIAPDSRHSLQEGLYRPSASNNPSVCPQQLKAIRVDGRLTALKITYVGDCYFQGPFEYYCLEQAGDLVCWDMGLQFVVRDERHYLWLNKSYDIWAEFELSGSP